MNAGFTQPAENVRNLITSRVALLAASAVLSLITIFSLAGADALLAFGPVVANGLVLILWLLAALGIGLLLLRAMRFACEWRLRIVIAMAGGLGAISVITLMLGSAGLLNRVSAMGLVAIGALYAMISIFRHARRCREYLRQPGGAGWLLLAAAPVFGIAALCATLPPGLLWGDEPNGYDVTEYHLQVPREWYEAGRIIPLQHNVFSYFPFNVEMHYLLAMHLMGGPWKGMYLAQFMHTSMIALSAAAIYALLHRANPRGAVIACLFAAATPWLTLLAPVAYNEGGLLLFGTLAVGLAIRSTGEAQPLRWMSLAGAMAGFAAGSKLTALPMIVLPLPVVVTIVRTFQPLTLSAAHSGRVQNALRFLISFWMSAAATLSPWLIRNIAWAHNPLFPEATSFFGKAHWSDVQVQRWQNANHLPRTDQQNIIGRSTAGWEQVLGDARFGCVLLPLGLIAVALRRDREALVLGLLLVTDAAFWMCFTHLQSRFFVGSIPICALALGRPAWRVERFILSLLATAAAVGGTFFVASKLAVIDKRFTAYGVQLFRLAGLPKLDTLSQMPADYSGQVIELVGEAQAFFYDVPMTRLRYRTVFDVSAAPDETAEQAWTKGWEPAGPGVEVIRNRSELGRFRRTYSGIR